MLKKKKKLITFKHQNMKLQCPIKIKLSRKRLYLSKSFGVKIDENQEIKPVI